MSTQVGQLHRKSIVKDMRGNIITLLDEADGGFIIRNRQVVNQEKWKEYCRVQQDRIDSAKAIAEPKIRTDYPETKEGIKQEDKVSKLEGELAEMKEMLKQALGK